MDDQALDVCHVGQQRENLQVVDKPKRLLLAALDLERENRGAAAREILLIQRVVGMAGQSRVVDALHQRVLYQKFQHLFGVLRVPLQPQGERLDALEQQERREGRERRAGIPQ